MFYKNDWEIVDAPNPHIIHPRHCVIPLLVKHERTCFGSQNSLRGKIRGLSSGTMDKLGMEVVEVELRDAYAFGGGLHCCTADVYRESKCENLFPNL